MSEDWIEKMVVECIAEYGLTREEFERLVEDQFKRHSGPPLTTDIAKRLACASLRPQKMC